MRRHTDSRAMPTRSAVATGDAIVVASFTRSAFRWTAAARSP
jgi:hypothetical protein